MEEEEEENGTRKAVGSNSDVVLLKQPAGRQDEKAVKRARRELQGSRSQDVLSIHCLGQPQPG